MPLTEPNLDDETTPEDKALALVNLELKVVSEAVSVSLGVKEITTSFIARRDTLIDDAARFTKPPEDDEQQSAMLDAQRAKGFAGTVAFRFGEMVYVARVASGAIEIGRGAAEEGAALISGEPTEVAAVAYGGAALDLLQIEGDRKLAKRFLSLFTLPPKAS